MRTGNSQPCVSTDIVSLHTWTSQYSAEYLKGTFCRSPEFSLGIVYSFPVPLHTLCWSPWTLSPISSTESICQTPPGLTLPSQHPENSFKKVSLGNYRTLLICFLSLRECYSLLFDVWYQLENCFSDILAGVGVISGERVNLQPFLLQ